MKKREKENVPDETRRLRAEVDRLRCENHRLLQDLGRVNGHLRYVQNLVDAQSEDEGLWLVPAEGLQSIAEAYLQQQLRKLHERIERGPAEYLEGLDGVSRGLN